MQIVFGFPQIGSNVRYLHSDLGSINADIYDHISDYYLLLESYDLAMLLDSLSECQRKTQNGKAVCALFYLQIYIVNITVYVLQI